MKNYRYKVIINWSEIDNCYIAEVPDLAGCMSDGKTYTECLSNLEVIIDEWIETANELGKTIPIPISKELMYA